MPTAMMKDEVNEIMSQLADDATWGDFDAARMRRSMNEGIRALREGRIADLEAYRMELKIDDNVYADACIRAGLDDARNGRFIEHDELMKQLGLDV